MVQKIAKEKEVNMPVHVVQEIYDDITTALGKPPVIFGGRAVNILCFRSKRPTDDLDLVTNVNINNPEVIKRLIDASFMPRKDKDNWAILEHTRSGFGVDLFYSRQINGLEISWIIETAEPRKLKKGTVLVASPAILLLMKYDAHRPKDLEDFNVILENYYGGDVHKFISEERQLLQRLCEQTVDPRKMNRFLKEYYEEIMEDSNKTARGNNNIVGLLRR